MKHTFYALLGALIVQLLPPVALAQYIDVPNVSHTNAIPLGNDPLIQFGIPSSPGGYTPPTAPTLLTNFSATGFNFYSPPDTMGAVGTNRLMIMVNGEVRIEDRTGALISTTNLNRWWVGAGTYTDVNNNFVFDPHVIYDPYNNRWIAIACANVARTDAQLLLGVSATSDPSGSWYQYAFPIDPLGNYFADYPFLGFNKDKVAVTFTYAANNGGPDFGSALVVFDKNVLYTGATPLYGFQNLAEATYGYNLQPVFTYDTNVSTLYMVQTVTNNFNSHGRIRLYSITGAATNFTLATVGTAQSSAWVDKFTADTARQLGTTVRMNTLDDRMCQAVYRNGSIWCAHTVCLPLGTPTHVTGHFKTSHRWALQNQPV